MERGQVQTNEHGVNVLVDTVTSDNKHYYHENFHVQCEALSNEQIKKAYLKAGGPTIEDMKDKLKKEKGFAISNCKSEQIANNDLVSYKRLSTLGFDGMQVFILPDLPGNEINQFGIYVNTELGMTASDTLKVVEGCGNAFNTDKHPKYTKKEIKEAVEKWLPVIHKHTFPVLT